MTDTIADRAVTEIAKATVGESAAEKLREAVRGIQVAIDEESGLDRVAALEFAYDACFYSTDEFSLP